MFTISYKGFYIHGYIDRPECSVSPTYGGYLGDFKSLHAAKCWITRQLNPARE